eukprot:COSAG02_NODE_2158_length_9635_cov_32.352139_8_plen_446_part_00
MRRNRDVSNLIISAVDTGGVAKFAWEAPEDTSSHSVKPSKSALDCEVNTRGHMPRAGKLADWVGVQEASDVRSTDTPAGRPMKLRLVRLSADNQQKGITAELNAEEPWKDFVPNATSALSTVSELSNVQRDHDSQGGPQDADTRELYALLGEIQLRLAQDHRVPELIADTESKLTPTPASQSHSKYAHITGRMSSPREYTLVEVKADIKRLVQRSAAFHRCGMLKDKTVLLTQLNAHRDLLQNLWAFVDNGGAKGSTIAAQEPKRWYAGSASRKQRPVTGITERLGKQRKAAKSFTALIPTTTHMVLTPDDPSVVGTANSYSYSMSTAQGARASARSMVLANSTQNESRDARRLSGDSQKSPASTAALRSRLGAGAGVGGSMLSFSTVQDTGSRKPMQLERHEYLPPLQVHDRSLARSRKSPYRMRPKLGGSSEASSKYVVGRLR